MDPQRINPTSTGLHSRKEPSGISRIVHLYKSEHAAPNWISVDRRRLLGRALNPRSCVVELGRKLCTARERQFPIFFGWLDGRVARDSLGTLGVPPRPIGDPAVFAAAGSQPKTASDRIFLHRILPTNPRESYADTSSRLIRTSVT